MHRPKKNLSIKLTQLIKEKELMYFGLSFYISDKSRRDRSCADPESYDREGPLLTIFLFKLLRGERIQIPL